MFLVLTRKNGPVYQCYMMGTLKNVMCCGLSSILHYGPLICLNCVLIQFFMRRCFSRRVWCHVDLHVKCQMYCCHRRVLILCGKIKPFI